MGLVSDCDCDLVVTGVSGAIWWTELSNLELGREGWRDGLLPAVDHIALYAGLINKWYKTRTRRVITLKSAHYIC